MVERPDLEGIRTSASVIDISADTRGWLADLLIKVIDYAAELERELAEARAALRGAHETMLVFQEDNDYEDSHLRDKIVAALACGGGGA